MDLTPIGTGDEPSSYASVLRTQGYGTRKMGGAHHYGLHSFLNDKWTVMNVSCGNLQISHTH